jgi:hypothetical protein
MFLPIQIRWCFVASITRNLCQGVLERSGQRACVDLPCHERCKNAIEFHQWYIGRRCPGVFDRQSSRDARLSGFGQHGDLLPGELCQLGDLLPGHDEGVRKFFGRRCKDDDIVALDDFFRDDEGPGVSKFSTAADQPGRGVGAADGDSRQSHVDAVFFEKAKTARLLRGTTGSRRLQR